MSSLDERAQHSVELQTLTPIETWMIIASLIIAGLSKMYVGDGYGEHNQSPEASTTRGLIQLGTKLVINIGS